MIAIYLFRILKSDVRDKRWGFYEFSTPREGKGGGLLLGVFGISYGKNPIFGELFYD